MLFLFTECINYKIGKGKEKKLIIKKQTNRQKKTRNTHYQCYTIMTTSNEPTVSVLFW